MKRTLPLSFARCICCLMVFSALALGPLPAHAEGFLMTEWSARGLSLAGGMVGRADDASAIAYNAAGITQLPGTQVMGGITLVSPYGSIERETSGGSHTTHVKPATWTPFHGYITHQLNDNVWLGFGMFSRFGLGNGYSGDWGGKYNLIDVGLQTVSAVPTVAYKINDMFSVALGLDLMYLSMYEGVMVPGDNQMSLDGNSLGIGFHAGVHARFNEQWSAGLTYKSQVTHNVQGNAEFTKQRGPFQDSKVSGTIQLPDSIAFGLAYKPIEELSFEVGTVWTRWSTYNALNMYFDEPSGMSSIGNKEWKDGWNFNASVEYKALDWLTLRAGYWYETAVVNEKYADYMVPSNGRNVLTLGTGFHWDNWTLDLAYAHVWIMPLSYDESAGNPEMKGAIARGTTKDAHTDMYSVSLGYTF